ncbi:MAG TPA: AraC family transcriptional regulator [Clostridiaceae bacterium]|jgi:AraC-like DNA-binding protein|nr:AraC family transcriptional regulator [Clostridiaceae bacterium]
MMKVVHFTDLLNQDFFAAKVIAHYHYWNDGSTWSAPETGRTSHAFMYFYDCSGDYYINNQLVTTAYQSNIAYLPKCAKYTARFSKSESVEQISNKTGIITDSSVENYFIDGSHTKEIKGKNMKLSAIFVGFDLYDGNHNEIALSESIEVFRFKNHNFFFSLFQDITMHARYSNISPVKLSIDLYEIIMAISQSMFKQQFYSETHMAIYPAIKYLATNDLGQVTVPELAKACGLCPSRFRILFKEVIGQSPIDYIQNLKIEKARQLLQSGEMTVTDVAFNIGFHDLGYFSRFYKKKTGRNPSEELLR